MLRRTLSAAAALSAVVPVGVTGWSTAAAGPAHCARADRLAVPGAAHQVTACLDHLSTEGTARSGHTNRSDWSGLHASGTDNPSGIPGIQVDGYFPDESTN
ncbi:MAG: hypothetical protein ACRDPK_05125 [Carbonactinosporaceae bacterium]